MYIAYFDESGDDGFPSYSSELFVLSGIYIHHQQWRDNYNLIVDFRRRLKKDFDIPIKWEIHSRALILDKNPYRKLDLNANQRKEILLLVAQLLSNLNIRIVNVVINKLKITPGTKYDVLDRAFTYSIQRIENDLNSDPTNKFLIITDEGRVGKMRQTARRIQVYNPIPSKFGGVYKREIRLLIEDPLPKQSSQSHFVQLADYVAFVVYLYSVKTFLKGNWRTRLSGVIEEADVIRYLDAFKSILNLKAAPDNPYGVVSYPK